ncbi:MAG: leucine-rich repeat domain-containing protein [Paludibacteraceae bacterium]|nr:leucine-rich repeat domain-containing protein [Paludibacteraceae bacterium]
MTKKLLASVMAFALCLFVSAADMVVKGKNGEDWKINVVDTSETFLRFKILSDSTVELTNESSCRGHESITIPEKVRIEGKVYTVTSIGYEAFYGCSSLTSINIPEGVTSIGYEAFRECRSLTSIKIPKGVTSIGGLTFNRCSSLTSINIPEGVTSIGFFTFKECSSLISINIPEGVTRIGFDAFRECSNLDIVIDNSKKKVEVGADAFRNCKSVKWLKD